MQNSCLLKEILAIFVIVLFIGIGIAPIINADFIDDKSEVTHSKNMKPYGPDPAIVDITGYYFSREPTPFVKGHFDCKIQNIGDENYHGSIAINGTITFFFFPSLILSTDLYETYGTLEVNGIWGPHTNGYCLETKGWFPPFIYKVCFEISPENYDADTSNNIYSEYFLICGHHIFGAE